MAINSNDDYWNLWEICETENGITKLPDNYKHNGNFKFLDYKNVYNKDTLTDFKYDSLPKINIFEKDIVKHYKSRNNMLAVTWSSETNKDVFQAVYIQTNKPFVLNGFSKMIKIKKIEKIKPKWLTWYLNYDKKIQKTRESIVYTTRCNMTINELKNIWIKKTPIQTQQEIINIIEPKEPLFLKYHEVVDISDLDKFDQSWSNLINIIEPFENQKINFEEKIKKLIELTNLQINNMKFYDYELSYFSHFQGFSFSSNDFAKDGKYKIFKIANITNLDQNIDTTNKLKSEVLLKTSNVVTGLSGSIGTSSIIIHDDIFQLNQRLIAIKTEYPLLIKLVIEKNKKILESLSTGSVQMNITKNDILNLKYDSSLNNNLNYIISKLYIIYSKKIYLINSIIHKLIELYVI